MKYFCIIIIIFFCCSCDKTANKIDNATYGNSLSFDGIDDQLIVPNYEQLRLYSGTIEAWFKITKKNGEDWHALVAKELAYQITLFDYKLTGYDWKLETKNIVTDSIPINEWHHTALTFIDTVENGSQLYFDGRAIGKPFKIHILNHGTELYIGSNRFNPQHFCGNIDEVRIWKTLRTPEEIYLNYLTEIDPISTGLVLYYKFNEGIPFGDNQQKQHIRDETLNNLTGNLYKFELKGNTSNFVKDSPLIQKDFFSIKAFFRKYIWLLLLIFGIQLFIFFIVKLRTRWLTIENKKLDLLVTKKTIELNNSLQQKEVLIQEIHHRVKNNLQFIISLIDFELTKVDMNSLTKGSLQNTSRRLLAMVLVDQMLYREDNFETISTKDYLCELINTIKDFTDSVTSKIVFDIDIADFPMNISQCTAIGIITSEMITNCIKHAFTGIAKPKIKIHFAIEKTLNVATFIISDNGVGMKTEKDFSEGGVGKKMIDIFCRQLQGSYSFENDEGVVFKLTFPLNELVKK